MKKLLVILHMYYPDQADYFVRKLGNICGCDWKLVVTYTGYDAVAFRTIRDFVPDAEFMKVENIGYDIWPFIKVIKKTDLAGYDYILKLHTKGSTPGYRINGLRMRDYRWRDLLVDAILGSPAKFRACLECFEKTPKAGIICSYELKQDLHSRLPENGVLLRREKERIGLVSGRSEAYFCAGSIFMARAAVLGRIQRLRLTDEMWGTHFSSHSQGTLAHVYERLLCIMVQAAGYEMYTVRAGMLSSLSVFVHNTIGRALSFLFCIDRDEDGRKFIMLFGFKFSLGNGSVQV